MKSRLYSFFKFAVGWPLSLLAFFFIGKIIADQAPTLQSNVHTLNWQLLFYGIISFMLYYFMRSLIWQKILKYFGYDIPLKESNYLWAMSELKRYVPGKVWAYLGRAVIFRKKDVDNKDITKGMIIELELFVLGCCVISLLALPFLLSGFNSTIGWIAVFFVGLGIFLFAFNSLVIARSEATKQSSPGLRSIRGLLHFVRNDAIRIIFPPFPPLQTLLLTAFSSVGLLFFGLGNYFVISSFSVLDPQLLPQLVGVFVFTFLVAFLSFLTPAGLGVREGLLIFALSKITATGVAAFAALFSRLLLIVSELLYLGLSIVWNKVKNRNLSFVEKWIAAHPHETVVICLALIYTIYFSTISMLRYDHFYAGRFDLGNMAQTVWNTSVGNFFMLTDPNGTREVSRLAFHADFILAMLAPFYWLWPDPRNLLVIQTVVVAAGAFFVYLITKKVLNTKLLGVVLAFVYLINPSIQRVNIYDFHAPALATTFLLATFYFYLKKQYVWFIVFALLAAFCKEQIWAILAVFGIFLMIHHKKFIFGALMFFFSAGMFYFLVSYAIPQSLGSEHFALDYFSDFGSSPAEIIKTIILSPDKLIAILMEEEHIKYLKQIFGPLGYLSYLAPWMLIFAGPDLLINLISSNPQLHYIYYQYTAAITPFIFIAAIYGIWVLKWILKSSQLSRSLHSLRSVGMTILIFYILYHSLNGAYLHGPLPGSKEPNLHMMTRPEKNRDLIDKTIASIPQDAKVAASNNVGAHFSNRRDIYVLPVGAAQADYLVFLLTNSEKGSSFQPQVELVEKLKNDPRYRIIVQKDEFTVFEKRD